MKMLSKAEHKQMIEYVSILTFLLDSALDEDANVSIEMVRQAMIGFVSWLALLPSVSHEVIHLMNNQPLSEGRFTLLLSQLLADDEGEN